MIQIQGSYNTAVCYCDELEESASEQIRMVCEQPEFSESKIRIMPDVHAGAGCTIGTTMTIKDKVVPGMVGVDIGCGMETVEIDERELDFRKLDEVIQRGIPAGREVREDYHALNDEIDLSLLRCVSQVQTDRVRHSIGTLGGGNHFIEVDRADDGRLFLVIHSGSRHLGTEVAGYYQDEAYKQLSGNSKAQLAEIIAVLKAEGRQKEIQATLKRLQEEGVQNPTVPKDLAYATGSLFENYVHDMGIIQRFAVLNRQAMTEVILRELGLTKVDEFTTSFFRSWRQIVCLLITRLSLILIPIVFWCAMPIILHSDVVFVCSGSNQSP